VRISRQTGDRSAEAKYSMQLRNLYPGSQETRMLMGDK
jgi:Tfp pilus assembly protein PilF